MAISFSLGLMSNMRIGYSEDIHRLVENRKLMLGGIEVPFHLGEEAHSDGDVLLHAIGESILGALNLGDLGTHFPDNSEKTLNMSSKLILAKINEMMVEKGYEVVNIDSSIVLEKPKIKDYIPLMKNSVASILNISPEQVSIKAGTNEGVDEIGKMKAIKAVSIVLLKRK